VLDVDRLEVEVGSTVELTDVLFLSEGGTATVGTPTVADARVVAEVVEHGRDKKILVFKYKNKTRYRRRYGHRQDYTRLAIKRMGIGEIEVATAKPKRASRKKTEAPDDALAAPAVTAEAAEVKAKAKKAAPRRARKPAAEGDAQPARAPRARKAVPKAATPTGEPEAKE
jgi:large subunit ribosomal protein L21